jgi:pimeloyl-ACP methyl ester carboxylesterase
MQAPDTSRLLDAEFARIDGHQLDVRTIGPAGAAPSLVFLHEGLGSVELWRSYPAAVAEATGERAVTYSRYGHGWSDVQREPRPIDFMDHEAFVVLPELIETAGVVDPILVGHSDGASVALLYASRHPVAAIVLLAPHVFTEPVGLREIRDFSDRFDETDLAERMAKYHHDPTATVDAWRSVWLNPDFESWNIEPALAGITCPVLLVQGEDDEYGTIAQIDAIAGQIGGTVDQLLLADCKHSPHLDRPAITTDVTARFIKDARAAHTSMRSGSPPTRG